MKIVVHGCSIEQIGKQLVWAQLQMLVPNHRIEIVSIVKGSVIITVKSSIEGIDEIYTLYQSGTFNEILGFPIQRLEILDRSLPPQRRLKGRIRPIAQWVGRDELLTELAEDLKNHQVLVLHGQGGIGKTSLAAKLMAACGVDRSSSILPATCLYDNALYCEVSEADNFDSLVAKFLTAFGMSADREGATPAQVIELILTRLHQERWLVTIDNLESLMEPDSSKSKSPDVGDLLNSLAYGGHNSQIIITSRKYPDDLHDRQGNASLPGEVRDVLVKGISDAETIQLLRNLGMQDSEKDLAWIAERVKGNVLVINLLSKLYAHKPGQLSQEPEWLTDEATPIVKKQWESQNAAAQDLLERMCVLRIEMDLEALTTLRLLQADGGKMEFTKKAKKATKGLLDGLVKCGLVEENYDRSAKKSYYTLHRLIAETLQAIFEKDLEQLWRYAARMYGSIDRPAEYLCLEDLQFLWEEAHFHWESRFHRESRSIETGERLISIVINDLLPKLKMWCHWDLEELWLTRILAIVTQSDNQEWIATYLGLLGYNARSRSDYDKAEELYNEALDIWTQLGNRAKMAATWILLGDTAFYRNRDYDKAEDLYNKALDVYTQLGDREGMATSWSALGKISHFRDLDYDKAEDLYNKALTVYTQSNNREGMAASWCVLGDIYHKRDLNYDRAEELYNKALDFWTRLGNRARMAIYWGLLGDISHERDRDYDKAEDLYNKALDVWTRLGNRERMANSLISLGKNELMRGDLGAAEIWLKKALSAEEDLQMTWHIAMINFWLAQLYRARDNEEKAQQYYAISHALYTKLSAKGHLEIIEQEWL